MGKMANVSEFSLRSALLFTLVEPCALMQGWEKPLAGFSVECIGFLTLIISGSHASLSSLYEVLPPAAGPACVHIMIHSIDFCFSPLTLSFRASSQTCVGCSLEDFKHRVQNHHVLFMRANMVQLQHAISAAPGLIELLILWLMLCWICVAELLLC